MVAADIANGLLQGGYVVSTPALTGLLQSVEELSAEIHRLRKRVDELDQELEDAAGPPAEVAVVVTDTGIVRTDDPVVTYRPGPPEPR